MKKLLLGTAAVAVAASFVASPASAQVQLDLGGHYKGYLSWLDQDTTPNRAGTPADESEDERAVDWQQETEIHFTGETTLDNGLTVGFHAEADIDGNGGDDFDTEEAYAFFSGAWGRVNAGREDGAAYLLQVAAPSADSNIDGLRQYVQPVNYGIVSEDRGAAFDVQLDTLFNNALAVGDILVDVDDDDALSANDIVLGANGANVGFATSELFRFDYDQAVAGYSNKLTYMTPVFNGFQLGASYTPEIGATRDFATGNNNDDTIGDYGDVYEVALRYEGQWDEVGVTLGAGYTHASSEQDDDDTPVAFEDTNGNGAFDAGEDIIATLDDREAWNVGADFDWMAFGIGVAYTEDDLGVSGDLDRDTLVVGIDYTTGPFKIGGSWYNQDQEFFGEELETDRYSGGVVYTYGPGMTFRGSVAYIEHEGLGPDSEDVEATSVMLGTQINF